jgi:hypothetical protein
MASPNTVVMQYMVLFSHRTVRLPAHTNRQAQPGAPSFSGGSVEVVGFHWCGRVWVAAECHGA